MAGKATGKTSEKPPLSVRDKVVDAALILAENQKWERVGFRDIAHKAALSLPEIYDHFEDRSDILAAMGRRIDKQVLENVGGPEPGESCESHRDRLFDVLMERFEVLNKNRAAIISILSSFRLDPKQAVISLPHLCRSMSWMLEAAGIETGGLGGAVKVAGLTSLYLVVLRTWKSDDTPDLSRTMAALDKALARADRAAGIAGF